MMRVGVCTLILYVLCPTQLFSQAEVSVYGGVQNISDSKVSIRDPGGAGLVDIVAGWQDGFENGPKQYGFRLTWWHDSSLGVGVNFDHAPIIADDTTLAATGITALELAGGVNLVTVNAFRRWQDIGMVTPYVGAGFGVSVPSVEYDSGSGRTSGFQLGGPAVQWVAGASIPLNNKISVFGEYKGSYSSNSIELVSSGQFESDVTNNALNLGLSLGF